MIYTVNWMSNLTPWGVHTPPPYLLWYLSYVSLDATVS